VSNSTHYFRPLQSAVLARSTPPGMDREREAENKQRDGDRRLQRALAEAFQRGDHLPAGTVVPLTLIG
jgi:hypothetical protein